MTMTPEQLADEIERRERARHSWQEAPPLAPLSRSPFMDLLEERAVTHGRIELAPAGDYYGLPILCFETVLDTFVIATRRPSEDAP